MGGTQVQPVPPAAVPVATPAHAAVPEPPAAVPVPRERVRVDFAGEGEGADEMSWGMWEIWNAMSRQCSALPIGGRAPLEPGTTVADLADELRYLMGRFPSMRTRLRFDAEGRPTQQLFAAGRIELDVYDAPPEGDPDEFAAAVEENYRSTAFDYAGAWPVRMGAVLQHGRPTHLVTVMHHLVTDALGGLIMLREVSARESAPVTGMQQLDQAGWQGSPAGRRQNERALRHWEGVLRTIPARQLPGPIDPRTPRHWVAEFRSPALTAALPAIAARTGADVPAVLLALFALGLHRATGISPVVVRPVVNNRFRPGLSDVVCMVAQAGVCVLDVEGATVEQAIELARRGSMSAYKHAYFHPGRLDELIARVCAERGEDVSIGCFFNDRTEHRGPADAQRSSTAEDLGRVLQAARQHTTFRWTARRDTQSERFFVHVDDTPEGVLLFEIRIDTHHMPPAYAEAFAQAMESAAITAALPPPAPEPAGGSAPVPAPAPGPAPMPGPGPGPVAGAAPAGVSGAEPLPAGAPVERPESGSGPVAGAAPAPASVSGWGLAPGSGPAAVAASVADPGAAPGPAAGAARVPDSASAPTRGFAPGSGAGPVVEAGAGVRG